MQKHREESKRSWPRFQPEFEMENVGWRLWRRKPLHSQVHSPCTPILRRRFGWDRFWPNRLWSTLIGRLWPNWLWPKLVFQSFCLFFFWKKKQKNKMKKCTEEQTPFGAPKGGAPKGVGHEGWGAQNFALCFLSRHHFALFVSFWESSREILVVFWSAGAIKCASLEFSGCRVKLLSRPEAARVSHELTNTNHKENGTKSLNRW